MTDSTNEEADKWYDIALGLAEELTLMRRCYRTTFQALVETNAEIRLSKEQGVAAIFKVGECTRAGDARFRCESCPFVSEGAIPVCYREPLPKTSRVLHLVRK